MLALGLAALGRPGYITVGHGRDLGDISVEAMERRCHAMLDAAYAHGIRWFDAARSYGRAEEFLARWLPSHPDAQVSSKWGYRYTAGWHVDALVHEIKDHSLEALDAQWPASRALLGAHLALYQIHSVTPDSPVLEDEGVLARLRELGVPIGFTVSGPKQRETIERALATGVFSSVQATWNLLERSAEPALIAARAAGVKVIIKEALANGRLIEHPALLDEARAQGVGPDAIAIAAAAQVGDIVLSGAVTEAQLASNLTPATPIELEAEPPEVYWATRSKLPWN